MFEIEPLPYLEDSAAYYTSLRTLGWGIWLDSGEQHPNRGRFDIISAAPAKKLIATQQQSYCLEGQVCRHYDSAWDTLQREWASSCGQHSHMRYQKQSVELPFHWGLLGYLGYDLGRQLERLQNTRLDDSGLPTMAMGVYDWAVVQDHRKQESWFTCRTEVDQGRRNSLLEQLRQVQPKSMKPMEPFRSGAFSSNTSREAYLQIIGRIRDYIAAGDCYQVNFAQRFQADCHGDPFAGYLQLRHCLPSPYSVYFETEDSAILSLSPEQFLQADADQCVITRPIKGTCPRGSTADEDALLARQLQESAKNRAENLMIVDLLRNDLSKVCGAVETRQLFTLESYANVHHLVSTVSGRLRPQFNSIDLLRACFPGGSITGAPKVRAMLIIEDLEQSRRSVYCGSIGYIDCTGRMDTNIAIRTLAIHNRKAYTWGGGGIVFDSDPVEEYQESLTKIGVLLRTLGEASSRAKPCS